LKLITLRVHE